MKNLEPSLQKYLGSTDVTGPGAIFIGDAKADTDIFLL